MSEFTVCRTLDTHPALRYCLLLDDMRIAGGKPDYRGDNILISWRTKETYGPVDAIKTENGQLATEKTALERRIDELCAEVERGKAEFKKMDVWHSQELKAALDENAKLRELCEDLHILCYPQSYEWEVTDHTYEKYSPCELCEKTHGGKSPCASTSRDMSEECCKPFQAEVVADRMRELGIEVEA